MMADDDDDAWDGLLAPPAQPLDAPPPPPPCAAPRSGPRPEPGAPAPQAVLELGGPPPDAMGAAKWAYDVQMKMADDVIRDPTLSPGKRRVELQKIFASAAKWMTDALRFDVAKTIEDDKRQVEAKRRGRAAAQPVKVAPPPPMAKVIPIKRDA